MKDTIFQFFDTTQSHQIIDWLNEGTDVNLSNVKNSLKGFLALYLQRVRKRTCLYVTASDAEAAQKMKNLEKWGKNNVYYFPLEPVHDYFSDAYSPEITCKRMAVIEKVFQKKPIVICTSAEALLKKMPAPGELKNRFLSLAQGQTIEPDMLAERLVDMGYLRVEQVETRGQFARRGEILDIFPITAEEGVRIDFFDDEIESLARFEILSQRSVKPVKRVKLSPVRETVLDRKERGGALKRLQEKYAGDPVYSDLLEKTLAEEGEHDETLGAFYKRESNFIEYLQEDSLIFWDECDRSREVTRLFFKKTWDDFETLINAGEMFPDESDKYIDFEQLRMAASHYPQVYAALFSNPDVSGRQLDLNSRSIESFVGRIPYFSQYVTSHLDSGYRIGVCCKNKKTMENVRNFLEEQELDRFSDGTNPGIEMICGEVSEGFELPSEGLAFVNESEIFREQPQKARRKRRTKSRKIDSFSALSVGDYVVHDIHGIGVYQGIEKMTLGEVTRDMMVIAYKGEDKLYLPVEQMDSVQAYIGTGGERKPRINTLGRPDWEKTKAKAKKAVEDMADELIALYAKRRSQPGFAFGRDTAWQQDFESRFEYEETDDQLRCVDEIKKDMEKPVPMDRLLCGDVGYGKTEVALRAAFKAVMENKQVAVLVPTTILAQQHYNTMTERFAHFPIGVQVISRFKSAGEQRLILKDLAAGRVDIIVGTHRLLSKDVTFKDLGLLIIDEEQRFGVKAKEKLKSFRENVDVLTLSATPIPRTLHMSMTGVRDMSVIAEPPTGRRPVQTYVMRDNAMVIGDAIARELNRGGQVFFVHNRIKDIRETADRVARMAPGAKIVVAHGRMSGETLEKIMVAFLNKEYDVLVTTAIVESGMDVKNANTMIIDNGDSLGLSQLYQLRGRVGRASRQAYCYIVYKKQVLSEIAAKRLKAIKDFTAFGSGFKVAMRDLEIRGAGNLLGAEQSGHLFSIGYEMYCRILEETIAEHTNGQLAQKEKEPVKINLEVDAFIPEGYIDSEVLKYDAYKKIATVGDEEDKQAMIEELTDRFGSVPRGVNNLLSLAMMGHMAAKKNMVEIRQRGDAAYFYFDEERETPMPDGETILALFETYHLKLKADRHRDGVWRIDLNHRIQEQMVDRILNFLKKI